MSDKPSIAFQTEVEFLIDRMDELDFSQETDGIYRDFCGHVWPSAERLRMLAKGDELEPASEVGMLIKRILKLAPSAGLYVEIKCSAPRRKDACPRCNGTGKWRRGLCRECGGTGTLIFHPVGEIVPANPLPTGERDE